jgi:hypothetical protein
MKQNQTAKFFLFAGVEQWKETHQMLWRNRE